MEVTHGAYDLDYIIHEMPLPQVLAILGSHAIFKGEVSYKEPNESKRMTARLIKVRDLKESKKDA